VTEEIGTDEARPWRAQIFEQIRLLDASKMERIITIEADLSSYPQLPEWEQREGGLVPVPLLPIGEQGRAGQYDIERYADRYLITDEIGRIVPSVRVTETNLPSAGIIDGASDTYLCALIDRAAGTRRILTVSTWEPVPAHVLPVVAGARSESYVGLRGLARAGYYEFEIIVPLGVHVAKAVSEFEQVERTGNLLRILTVKVSRMTRRPAPGGTALYFALSPSTARRGKAWFNVVPDLKRSWVLVPVLPFIACLLLTLLAKKVASGDPGSLVTILLLALPIIAAVLTSIGAAQLANRFFPVIQFAAIGSYIVTIAEALVIAFKLPIHLLREWSCGLTAAALILLVTNIAVYAWARFRRPDPARLSCRAVCASWTCRADNSSNPAQRDGAAWAAQARRAVPLGQAMMDPAGLTVPGKREVHWCL
jgi:hypothetical protein